MNGPVLIIGNVMLFIEKGGVDIDAAESIIESMKVCGFSLLRKPGITARRIDV